MRGLTARVNIYMKPIELFVSNIIKRTDYNDVFSTGY